MISILLIDNYDSFTFNLAHYLESLDVNVVVCRNDEITVNVSSFNGVILSPGPGLPKDVPDIFKVLDKCDSEISVLGVCLGMQAICQYLGGELYNLESVRHGVTTTLKDTSSTLFSAIPEEMKVGLYHSWAVRPSKGDFKVSSVSNENVVMSIENVNRKLYGIQFHPESIMTEHGRQLLQNFVRSL